MITIEIVSYDNSEYYTAIEKFNCGHKHFNEFLKSADEFGTTFLFIDKDSKSIVGFMSFCCSNIKIKGKIEPAIEIKLFAIDEKWQGEIVDGDTLAKRFMKTFIEYFMQISEKTIKADYVVLHSMTKKSTNFYKGLNFIEVETDIETGEQEKVRVGAFEKKCAPMFLKL